MSRKKKLPVVRVTKKVEHVKLDQINFDGAYLRRLMSPEVHKRWKKSRGKISPHGSVEGSPQQIAEREAWFCHNYPMAKCHRGAYRLGNGLSVVFANDGYPDYNLTALTAELNKRQIPIVAKVVEHGYTLLLLVKTGDLVALDNWIWSAWHYRCHERVKQQGSEESAVIYGEIQKKIAYDTMRELGLECARLNPSLKFVRSEVSNNE